VGALVQVVQVLMLLMLLLMVVVVVVVVVVVLLLTVLTLLMVLTVQMVLMVMPHRLQQDLQRIKMVRRRLRRKSTCRPWRIRCTGGSSASTKPTTRIS
jgi:hypothetical protein